MVCGMKWSELRDDAISDSRVAAKARIFLLAALFIACGCLAGSVSRAADVARGLTTAVDVLMQGEAAFGLVWS
jgi:hypothetical protein